MGWGQKLSSKKQSDEYEKKRSLFFLSLSFRKKIVGIVEVVKEYYPDPTDKKGRFVVVDVKAKKKLKKSVSLEEIKSIEKLSNIALIKQSRLSVMPLKKVEWDIIIKISEKN